MKKTVIISILLAGIVLSAFIFFSIFGFAKVDIYPKGSSIKMYRKIKNENFTSSFLKKNTFQYLEREELILHKNPKNFDTIFSEKQNLCTRLIAKPGDTLYISDTKVYVNNKTLNEEYDLFFLYRITMPHPVDFQNLLSDYNIEIIEIINDQKSCNFVATQEQADDVAKIKDAINVRKIYLFAGKFIYGVFPAEAQLPWNPDNFGAVIIPKKGETVSLNRKNIPLYKYIIEAHEGNELFLNNYSKIEINGKTVTEYTFRKNYYFVINDNRYNYNDSRGFGFVPEDEILGKLID
ncbi:S26 family signal peptidase [Bacteroidales bacterium OttesenSCG-928-I21]|nr:S26 family signal peptidase [Bacteroidales bacterium OttesenSCG-928-I21]